MEEKRKREALDSDDDNMPFTDNSSEDETYLNSEVAYEKWKYREITRIKRSREALDKHLKEENEVKRRR